MEDGLDLEVLSSELEKFSNQIRDGEDSDGGQDGLESSGSDIITYPGLLDKYLLSVARTGNPILPWKKINVFIRHKISSVLTTFYDKFGAEDVDSQNLPPFNYIQAKEKLLQVFDAFHGAPFTIQRLCEILIDPTANYKKTDKLLRGLEKTIFVVSTVGRVSEDCSDPQQRATLFNGLQAAPIRSFRPPLPESVPLPMTHVTKFSDLKEDVARQHNGDDALIDDDEPSFEEEVLKQDMEDENLDNMDDVQPRLDLSSGTSLDEYGLSVGSVINIRRKRKDDVEDAIDRQQSVQTKRFRSDDVDKQDSLLTAESSLESEIKLIEQPEEELVEQEDIDAMKCNEVDAFETNECSTSFCEDATTEEGGQEQAVRNKSFCDSPVKNSLVETDICEPHRKADLSNEDGGVEVDSTETEESLQSNISLIDKSSERKSDDSSSKEETIEASDCSASRPDKPVASTHLRNEKAPSLNEEDNVSLSSESTADDRSNHKSGKLTEIDSGSPLKKAGEMHSATDDDKTKMN